MPQSYDNWDNANNPFARPRQKAASASPDGSTPTSSPAQEPGYQTGAGGVAESFGRTEPPASAADRAPGVRQAAQAAPRAEAQAPRSTSAQSAPVAYVSAPQQKSHGWIVAIVVIVCLFAFCALCVHSCSNLLAGGSLASASGPAEDAVAVIDIDGTIQYDGSACSPEGLKSLLDQASGDDHIKAVVLRVNSGGGTATAGEEMATYVYDFDKPIVVSSASINASAAYEISSQSDYIYVAKSTEIGAIGTAMEVTDVSGLFDMLGIDMEVIASADSKDSSYGYRPLTDEERAYYQHMVDEINEVFIANVAAGRSMSAEEVRALATGLPFTGTDAVKNGLADEVGTLEDALDKAAELAGIHSYVPYDLGFYSNYDIASLYYLLGGQTGGDDILSRLASRTTAL